MKMQLHLGLFIFIASYFTMTGGNVSAGETDVPAAVYQEADKLAAQKNYDAASALLRKNLLSGNNRANAATLYRLGLITRAAGQENAARDFWRQGQRDYPTTENGRLCALALADAAYAENVESTPNDAEWEKIRDLYSDAIGMDGARFLDAATTKRITDRLNQLNEKLVFTPEMKIRGAEFYTVRAGDNLTRIAQRAGLDNWYSLTAINRVNPQSLRVGQRLKIMPGQVFILVNKRNFTLSWFLNGVFIRSYPCAIGALESETPRGQYVITKMEVNPDWRDPQTGHTYKYGEPGHLIGTRWMAMAGGGTSGLGIHGTVDPDSMGTKASNGCVRLLTKDVEELYGFVSTQKGSATEVMVIE